MTVKEAIAKKEVMEQDLKNIRALQKYFHGQTASPKELVDVMRVALEKGAGLDIPLRDMYISIACVLEENIESLDRMINDAV